MSLRVEIQKKLIELFRAGTFYVVSYDAAGLPSTGAEKLIPESVICNEVSSSLAKKAGNDLTYTFSGWVFGVYCSFTKEVDYSEFVLEELKDICFTSNRCLVNATAGNSIVVQHPPRHGEGGTQMRLNFNVTIKR